MSISDNQKKILTLLADGEFHSGTDLANAVNLSRSAIWKQLVSLSDLGLHYVGVSGRGYRLNRRLELLNQQRIVDNLTSFVRAALGTLEIHDQLDSTNSHLMKRAQQGYENAVACLAEHQTAGRGRRGREWISPYGSNIYLSILWRFSQSSLSEIAGLSLAVGVAVMRALQQFKIPHVALKWPNDIYWHGKKLGGILIEVSGESSGPCVVVIGIGINVYLPDTEAKKINQPWTDLHHILGHHNVSRNSLVAALLNHLVAVLTEFDTTGIAFYLNEWRSYDCLQHQSAQLFTANQVIDGIVQGIDDKGLLLFKRGTDGCIQAYASGEVSFYGSPA